MRPRTGARLWLLLALAISAGSTSRAGAAPDPNVAGDVGASAGYDSNLFLTVAAAPESPLFRPYRGPFARLTPTLTGALAGDDLRLELRLGADVRQTLGSGTLFFEDAQLGLSRPEVGPFDLRLGVAGGRFDATFDAGLRFTTAGGLLQAVWRMVEGWRTSATYRLTRRWFGAPERVGVPRDLTQEGELRLGYTARPSLAVGLAVGYLDLRAAAEPAAARADPAESDVTGTSLQRPSVGLDATVALGGGVTSYAGVWLGALRGAGVTTDVQAGGSVALSVRLGSIFDATARYELLVDRRRNPPEGEADFARHMVSIGLVAHGGPWPRAVPAAARRGASAALAEADPADPRRAGRSPSLSARVHFRLKAPAARAVMVIGSWNDWATGVPDQTLRIGGARGIWDAWLALPPGSHRYRFLVDGHPVRPPDAARYRADDFGGQDGIIDVCPNGVSCEPSSSLPLKEVPVVPHQIEGAPAP